MDYFWEIAPESLAIDYTVHEKLGFEYAGENFEAVYCPVCKADLPLKWWWERFGDAYNEVLNDFTFTAFDVPCSGAACILCDLICDEHQGFTRFSMDAWDTNLGHKMPDRIMKRFSEILGSEVSHIFRMG